MLRCAITDRTLHGQDEAARCAGLLHQARYIARKGVDFLQLREKDLPAHAVAALARGLLREFEAHAADPRRRTRLLINSRADIALACRADGVHLTSAEGQLTPALVRELYARAGLGEPVISLSCHTLPEVKRAGLQGAESSPDLILFGPIFGKRIASDQNLPGTGLRLLREACAAAAPVPVLALGGVTADTVDECLAVGAAGIAAIRLFLPGAVPLRD